MAVNPDAAISRGDVMRRLHDLERQVAALSTARRLEAAAVGRGGLRVHSGGTVRIQNAQGQDTFVASAESLILQGLLQVIGGGDISVTDGRLVASDEDGEVFAVDPREPRIFMRKELITSLVDEIVEELLVSPSGQTLVKFVFGEGFKAASAAATVTTSSGSYVSLSGGPSVSDVEVSDGGTMVVMVGCNGAVSSAVGLPDQAAAMSFQVSGASSVSPVDGNAYILAHADLGQDSFVWSRSMAVARITGLNAGTHTVAARYRKMFGGGSVEFTNRTLIAIGL